jgi:hypothetical protein
MRKPVSKHALRRALERLGREDAFRTPWPLGAFVDRLWHELAREAFHERRVATRNGRRADALPPEA